jgi:hypothetical protein
MIIHWNQKTFDNPRQFSVGGFLGDLIATISTTKKNACSITKHIALNAGDKIRVMAIVENGTTIQTAAQAVRVTIRKG